MLSVKGERVNDTLSLPSWCSQTSEDVEIQAVKSDEERSQAVPPSPHPASSATPAVAKALCGSCVHWTPVSLSFQTLPEGPGTGLRAHQAHPSFLSLHAWWS